MSATAQQAFSTQAAPVSVKAGRVANQTAVLELLAKLGVDLGSTGQSHSVRPENYISGLRYALACNLWKQA
jgi:hypothetical protein